MKIAILSDIHANEQALDAVLEDLSRFTIDRIDILGDLIDYGANPNEVINKISKLPNLGNVLWGNHERAILLGERGSATPHGKVSQRWTANELTESSVRLLQTRLVESAVDHQVAEYHAGLNDLGYPDYWVKVPKESAVATQSHLLAKFVTTEYNPVMLFIGHSHVQYYDFTHKVCNPGSVGQPRNGDPRAQYAIYDTDSGSIELRRVIYDVEKSSELIKEAGLPEYLYTRILEGK